MQPQSRKGHSQAFSSIRARALALLGVAFAALLGIAGLLAAERRQDSISNAIERVQATALLAAEEQNNVVAFAEQFLGYLGQARDLSAFSMDPQCPAVLAEALRREPRFSNIAIVAVNGDFLCAAVPPPGTINIRDRDYFKTAMAAPGSFIGEPVVSRSTGKAVLPFASTLRDDAGRVRVVYLVLLDLAWLNNHLTRGNYPPGARLGLISGSGQVLAGYPDPENWVGKDASQTAFFKALTARGGAGSGEAPGFDGVKRIYGFARLAATAAGPVYFWVGVDKQTVVGKADRAFAWSMAGATALLLVTIVVLWLGSERLFMRPVSALSDAARRLGEGDAGARTGLPQSDDELGQLARHFDRMAESLASTDRALRVNRALSTLSSLNHALVNAVDETDLISRVCRSIVEKGRYRFAWVGYAEHDAERNVRLVASWGAEADYLSNLRVSWADTERGQGPTGRATRERVPAVLRDAQTDPRYAPWRESAIRYRYRSSISVPLPIGEEETGTLNIYAEEPDAFGGEEVTLYSQGAADLTLGIRNLRAKAKLDRADARLRESARYERSLIEASPDPLVTINPEGKVTDVNEATVKVTGVPRDQLIGTDFSDYFTDPEKARSGYREVFDKGFVADYPLTLRSRDGALIDVLYNASVYRDEGGAVLGVFAAARDVTERKRAEARILELNATLEQRVLNRTAELAAANEELETFAYSVSHDLRAPLRAIDGFAKILEEDYADRVDEEGKDSLRRVRAAAQKMGHLIDDLLRLSRLARVEMNAARVDLSALARSVADALAAGEPARDVRFEIAQKVVARGDRRLLEVVLENLIGNAWKFTGKHPHARIEFGVSEDGGEPAYFVRDDGAGFDMAHAGKLFAPFQRLHGAGEFPGTGIGLATVRRVVARHGGRTWAEGAVEKGTTFYFTLPAAGLEAPSRQREAALA